MRVTVILVCLLMTCASASAQNPDFFDRVEVDFDQPVTINTNQTIPAGHYTFQQVRMQGHPRVFRVTDPAGRNVGITAGAASAMYKTASTFEVPGQTQVILKEVGGKRYLDKIWLQGQNHGYDFSLAEDARAVMASKSKSASSNKGSGSRMAGAQTPIVREIIVLAVPVVAAVPAGSMNSAQPAGQGGMAGTAATTPGGSAYSSATDQAGSSSASTSSTQPGSSAQAGSVSTPTSASGNTGMSSTNTSSGQSGTGTGYADAGSTSGSTTGTTKGSPSQQPVEVVGCVTGPYGGSYMLSSTSDGRRYQLEGDSDNIRENLGRTVTIWGSASGGTSTTAGSGDTGSAQSATPSSGGASGTQAGSGTQSSTGSSGASGSSGQPAPVIVTVQRLQLVSERCDELQTRR